MLKEDIIQKLEDEGILRQNIKLDEKMDKHTSFKIGGPADIFIKAVSIDDIKSVLKVVNETKIPLFVIGNGSNILVKDNGIRGIVLKIELKDYEIKKENDSAIVRVQSGMQLGFLAQKLAQKEISGFEELSGIPGTIGGAIKMNAGAHGKEIKDIVLKTKYMDFNGNIFEINNLQHEFKYRNSIFSSNKFIILETTLKLNNGKKEEIQGKIKEYSKYRKEKQPIEYPSAGSTFKRGEDFITAKLIDECDLKGYKIGGAEVSKKHAGFIINKDNATAKDIIDLITYVKEKVYEKFKKKIDLEIEIIGE